MKESSITRKLSKKQAIFITVWELIILAITVQLAFYYSKYHSYRIFIAVTGLLLMAGSAFAFYTAFIRKSPKEITYIWIACIMGLVFNLMLPVYCVPDEQIHYWKAYQLSNKMMFIDSDVKAITMRADDYALPVKTEYKSVSKINKYYGAVNDPLDDDSLVKTERYSTDIPDYLYIVPAVGITLGRLLGLNAILVFMLGRLFNNALFIAGAALAIRKIPVGKLIIMFTALLPMTLQQTASYSYDAVVIVCALLLCAYTLRVMDDGEMKRCDWIIFALAAMLIMPAKSYAYVLLALMPLITLGKRTGDKKKDRAVIFVVLAAVAFSIIVYLWNNVLFYVDRVPGATLGDLEYYSIGYLLRHPLQIWILIETTFRVAFGFYVSTMIGEELGWINIFSPAIVTYSELVLLLIASLKRKKEQLVLGKTQRIGLASTAILTCCFILGGMLLNWTPIGMNYIDGVQGRYFLPVLPTALVCLQTKEIEIESKWDNSIIYCNLMVLTVLVLCLVNRFQV